MAPLASDTDEGSKVANGTNGKITNIFTKVRGGYRDQVGTV